MTDRDASHRFGIIAQKWRDLAELRRAYFTELYQSGRWRRYYSEPDVLARLREVAAAAEKWAKVAPRPTDKAPVQEKPVRIERAASPPRRTAA